MLPARRRHGPGRREVLAGPGDRIGVVEVDYGDPGAARVVDDGCGLPPCRGPGGGGEDARVGGGGGPGVAAAGHSQGPAASMFGRSPHTLPLQARQFPAGCLARLRGRAGRPHSASRSAACRSPAVALMRPPQLFG